MNSNHPKKKKSKWPVGKHKVSWTEENEAPIQHFYTKPRGKLPTVYHIQEHIQKEYPILKDKSAIAIQRFILQRWKEHHPETNESSSAPRPSSSAHPSSSARPSSSTHPSSSARPSSSVLQYPSGAPPPNATRQTRRGADPHGEGLQYPPNAPQLRNPLPKGKT